MDKNNRTVPMAAEHAADLRLQGRQQLFSDTRMRETCHRKRMRD
ncbi:hypothetical protein [Bartonella apihabitans]|nr:hypothetical protein [Bartonella apihabitans]